MGVVILNYHAVNVLLVFSVNICLISAILNGNTVRRYSGVQNRRYSASDNSIPASKTVKQYQYSENLASLPELRNNEVHNNVKTIIYTRNSPQPYRIIAHSNGQYPIIKPHPYYFPKSYILDTAKLYTTAIVPQPFPLEKHVRFPVRIPVQKPKPFTVILQNKVPYQVPIQLNIPPQRPYPVHVPVENPVRYTYENVIPLKYPVEHLIQMPVEKPVPISLEHVLERPQELYHLNNPMNHMVQTPVSKPSPTNYYPNSYDPQSYGSQVNNKYISFLPGSTQQPYSLGTIHVPEVPSHQWNYSSTDWVPKQQYRFTNPSDHFSKNFNREKYITSDSLASNMRNVVPFSDTAGLKEAHGIKYETVKYEPAQVDLALQDVLVQSGKYQPMQKFINQNQPSRYMNQNAEKEYLQNNYHIFNGVPSQEVKSEQEISPPQPSINYYYRLKTTQPGVVPHNLINDNQSQMKFTNAQAINEHDEKVRYEDTFQYGRTNQEKIRYQTEDTLKYTPTAQPFFIQHSNQESFDKNKDNLEQDTPLPKSTQNPTENPQIIYMSDSKPQNTRETNHPQYSEPVTYKESAEYNHYATEMVSTPEINSYTVIAPTPAPQQTSLPPTTQPTEASAEQEAQPSNISEVIKKKDDIIIYPKPSAFQSPESIPITYSDVTRTYIRKTRRKAGKRKNSTRETVQ